MSSNFSEYLQRNIGEASEKLTKSHVLFLVGSGDSALDREVYAYIIKSSGRRVEEISEWTDVFGKSLSAPGHEKKVYLFRSFHIFLDQMSADAFHEYVDVLSHAGEWTCQVIFDFGIAIEDANPMIRKLSEASHMLSRSLFIVTPMPGDLLDEILIESMHNAGITPDEETAGVIRHDARSGSFTYTYVQLFVHGLAERIYGDATRVRKGSTVDASDYEAVGTLPFFMEYKGRKFLLEAEKIMDILRIEWIFRAMLQVRNGRPFRNAMTAAQISDLSGLPLEKAISVLDLAANPGHGLLSKTGETYTILSDEYLSHWSDLKKWGEREADAVDLYGKFLNMARQYEQGKGLLLTGPQIEEATEWRESNPLTIHWAKRYHQEFEYVMSYVTGSEHAFNEQMDAQERSRSRRLKMAYRFAAGAFLGILLILMLSLWAWQERNRAMKSAVAEKLAKKQTESALGLAVKRKEEALSAKTEAENNKIEAMKQAVVAINAMEKAETESIRALIAEKKAMDEKAVAVEAKAFAEVARQRSVVLMEEAVKSKEAAVRSEDKANQNFREANKLRMLQEARADALSVYEYYDNGNYTKGRLKATEAYRTFMDQGGSPYDRDFLTVLMLGKIRNDSSKARIYEEQNRFVKRMHISPNARLFGFLRYDGDVNIMEQTTGQKPRLIKTLEMGEVNGMSFFDDKDFVVSNADMVVSRDFNGKTPLIASEVPPGSITGSFAIPGQVKKIVIATRQSAYLYAYVGEQKLKLLKQLNIAVPAHVRVIKGEYHVASGKQLLAFSERTDAVRKVTLLKDDITAISGNLSSGFIAVGDEAGNLYIIDPSNGRIVSERNKLHLTRISSLETVHVDKGLDVLVSTGFDAAMNVFYFDQSQGKSYGLNAPITLREHKGWITDLWLMSSGTMAITFSNDKTMGYWPLLPRQFLLEEKSAALKK